MAAPAAITTLANFAKEFTKTENIAGIYWLRGILAKHIFGADLIGNDNWSQIIYLEHFTSLLNPDPTLRSADEVKVYNQLKLDAQAAQDKLDAILGVGTEEDTRVNNELDAYVTSMLAKLFP